MQQLTIEHKKSKDRRSGKGRVIALSRRIYRLMQTDVFYVESESTDNVYYYVKFKPDVIEWCTCLDNSTRGLKCKHLHAIEFANRMRTLKDTDDGLPPEAKVRKKVATASATVAPTTKLSYKDDDYSF